MQLTFLAAAAASTLTSASLATEAPTTIAPTATCWLVKEGSVHWPKGTDESQLLAFLDRVGVAVRRVASEDWDATLAGHERVLRQPLPIDPALSEELWQGKTVRLLASNDGRLRISPIRQVKSLAGMSPDEMLEMEETAVKMGAVFDKALQTADYYRWMPLGREAGQVGDQLYLELIPGYAFDGTDLDVAEKLRVDLYTMMNDKAACVGLLPEQVQRIKTIAPAILSQAKAGVGLEGDLSLTPIRGWKNLANAAQLAAQALLQRLHDQNQPVVPVLIDVDTPHKRQKIGASLPDRVPLPSTNADEQCPFCNASSVQRQRVYSGKANHVLSNHRPYMEYHLMTTPREHVHSGSVSASDDVIEKYQLWIRIDAIFRNRFKKPATAMIARCGRGAGQTVAHSHTHVLGIDPQEVPAYFGNALNEVMGRPAPALTEDQMADVREKIGPLFKPISVVAFDFGGVVNVTDGADDLEFIANAFGFQMPMERIKELFWTEVRPLNVGQIDEPTFWSRVAAVTGGQVPDNWAQKWREHYLAHHATPNHQVISIAKLLKQAGYLTPLLSDTIPSHAECNKPLYTHFDPLVLSYEAGHKKPEPQMYQSLLNLIQCAPNECVFIDDVEKNVQGAQDAGMHGIRFTSAEALVDELRRLAIQGL